MMREKNPPVRMESGAGWANMAEFSVLPTNNTEELQISCSASNSAGQLSETSRVEVTGEPSHLYPHFSFLISISQALPLSWSFPAPSPSWLVTTPY